MSPSITNVATQLAPAALAPVAARTSTLTGTAIDISSYEGLILVVLHGVRTAGDLTPTLEHSDVSGSGFVTVPTGIFAGFTAITAGTDFLQAVVLDASACKGFLRFIGTAANSPNHTYGATVIPIKKYR